MLDSFTPGALTFIAITFIAAGFVKGVLGMGLPTVAIGLLGLVMGPIQATALLLIPSMVTNVWQLVAGPDFGALTRRLATMMIGILVGTVAGASLMQAGSGGWATGALGVALTVYAIMGLASVRFTVAPEHQRWWGPAIGLVTGVISAATGVFAIPAVAYLQAIGLEKDDLVQALGLSFTVSTIGLAAGLTSQGQVHGPELLASLLALIPALIGLLIGQYLRGRIPAATFRRWFLIGLAVLGLHLAIRSML